MNKENLIIDTLTFMHEDEWDLLKASGKTIGDVIDTGFTKEVRAYVSLMSRLYEIYDDLENELISENVKNMDKLGFIKFESLNNKDLYKMSEMIKNIKPTNLCLDIPKIDLSNIVKRRTD